MIGLFLYAFVRPRVFLIVVMLISGMVLAFFRASNELIGEYEIRKFLDKDVVVTGTIDGDPETDEKGTKVKLINLEFGENRQLKLAGSLYIST